MPIDDPTHLRRDRAESFGAVAADYDRYRPGYPAELIDDLAALQPRRVLDVGCGTGKAARLLVERGLDVLGVEPDPQMAAVARAHGLPVEVSGFETWDAAGRTFDLVTCAQAWHWVEPRAGAAKAADVLTPGGVLALFWNFDDLEEVARQAVDEVYLRLAPDLGPMHSHGANRPAHRSYVADLTSSGRFAQIAERTYDWQRALPIVEWLGRLGTQSEHLLLGPQRLAGLQAALGTALTGALAGDPLVRSTGGTYLVLARGPQ